MKGSLNSAFHVQRTGDKPKSWLTPSGSVAVALRRNLGNVACALLGHVVLQDLAGCTVSRCEVKSGAALQAHARAFFALLKYMSTRSMSVTRSKQITNRKNSMLNKLLAMMMLRKWLSFHSEKIAPIPGFGENQRLGQWKWNAFGHLHWDLCRNL